MYIQEKSAAIDRYDSKAFDMYFGGMDFATFDIESTGLSPYSCSLVLSGFCRFKDGECKSTQIFAESPEDEPLVLEKTLSYMDDLDFVVTYNGAGFDIPFITERLKRNGIACHKTPFNLDLLPILRKFSSIRSFTPNLRQKTVETFMGLWEQRTDTIDGGQSVEMYYEYLISHDLSLKEKILLHNHDDVLQLYRLLATLGKADIHAALAYYGYPVKTELGTYTVKRAKITKNTLIVQGEQPYGNVIAYIDPGMGDISWDMDADGSFTMKTHLIKEGKMLLADLKNIGADADRFKGLPTYGSGYLIMRSEEETNFKEINMFTRYMIERIANNGF